MDKLNIVSTDTALSRLLTLEAARLGFDAVSSPAPLLGYAAYLVDDGVCDLASLPSDASIILLSEEEDTAAGSGERISAVLTKPLLLRELRFALTRLATGEPAPVYRPEKITKRRTRVKRASEYTRLSIDHEQKTATLTGGEPISLSDTEYKLLSLLYEHKNRPVSEEMAACVLGASESNAYSVYICYLRKKLERGQLRLIRTVRGKGYMLDIK